MRGATVAAVTGGAFTLISATTPLPAVTPGAGVLASTLTTAPAEAAEMQLVSSMVPVEPEPDVVGADDLVKAVQLTEQQRERIAADQRAAQEKAARARAAAPVAAVTGALNCGLSTAGLGPVKAHVLAAAKFLGCLFGEPTMHGVAGRAGTSDHPSGRAVDFMVDRATGDALAACALRNKEALGITYVIWRQRINTGSGWEAMEDRGGATANHFDHVHISFGSSAGGTPRGC